VFAALYIVLRKKGGGGGALGGLIYQCKMTFCLVIIVVGLFDVVGERTSSRTLTRSLSRWRCRLEVLSELQMRRVLK